MPQRDPDAFMETAGRDPDAFMAAQPQPPQGFWPSFISDVLPQTILGKYLGGTDIAQGIQTAREPGLDPKLMAAHQIGTGALKLTAPLTLPFGLEWAASHAVPAIAGTLGGIGGQFLGRSGAEAFGAPPGAAALTGDVTGLVAGGAAAGLSPSNTTVARGWRLLTSPQLREAAKESAIKRIPYLGKVISDVREAMEEKPVDYSHVGQLKLPRFQAAEYPGAPYTGRSGPGIKYRPGMRGFTPAEEPEAPTGAETIRTGTAQLQDEIAKQHYGKLYRNLNPDQQKGVDAVARAAGQTPTAPPPPKSPVAPPPPGGEVGVSGTQYDVPGGEERSPTVSSRELRPGTVIGAQAGTKNYEFAKWFLKKGLSPEEVRKMGTDPNTFNQHRLELNKTRAGQTQFERVREGPMRRSLVETTSDIAKVMESLQGR